MRNKDKLLSALENLLFHSLIENKSLSAGQRLESYMDTVDLDGLYKELNAVHTSGDKPNRCQLLVMRLVELYKPELFKTDKTVEIITATSLDDLHDKLMLAVEKGHFDKEKAESIFEEIKNDETEKVTLSDEVKAATDKFMANVTGDMDELHAEARKFGEELGVPTGVIDATENLMRVLTADREKTTKKPTIN